MSAFSRYIGIDYSGAETPEASLKGLRVYCAVGESAANEVLPPPPPGNQLEALKADREGQHSIRINDQWRICFVWKPDGAHCVEIVDCH